MSKYNLTTKQLINFIALQSIALNQADLFHTAIKEALIEAGLKEELVDKLFQIHFSAISDLRKVISDNLGENQLAYYRKCVADHAKIKACGLVDAREVYNLLVPIVKIYGTEQGIEALAATSKKYEKKEVGKRPAS